jgi:hypothetical protein
MTVDQRHPTCSNVSSNMCIDGGAQCKLRPRKRNSTIFETPNGLGKIFAVRILAIPNVSHGVPVSDIL